MAKRRGTTVKRATRRTQEERRRDTQQAVLKAAMTVLIEDGYQNFTASRVAKVAGVSRGAQENYFRTKNELIVAATRYTLARAADEARALAARDAGAVDPIETFLENSKSFYFSPTYLALMEIITVARRNPSLAKVNTPVVRDFRLAVEAIWIDALCAVGYRRRNVQSVVKIAHYVLRGMALASVWQPRKAEFPELLEAWEGMVRRELKRGRVATDGTRNFDNK
jgi:AcrR family transcriptional regulator